jgi:hypothetical protein
MAKARVSSQPKKGRPARKNKRVTFNTLYEKYKDHAAFYIVYIVEAHPSDGWRMKSNDKKGIVYKQPKTFEERLAVARPCLKALNIKVPFLIDDMKNSTEKAYSAWPTRIYVINKEGKVVMKAKKGPGGADVNGAQKALQELFKESESDKNKKETVK